MAVTYQPAAGEVHVNPSLEPPCPKCGRSYVRRFYAKGNRKPSYECAGITGGPHCGHVWTPKENRR